jgi:hypothetical protein
MQGPRSKVQRAYRHIDEIKQRSAPLDRDLYEVSNRLEHASVIHLKATRYKLAFRPKQDIPEVFGGIIGDAVSNLRSSLDYLANGIARAWIPSPPKIYFPLAKREYLVSHAGLTTIEQAIPGSKKLFLDEIRPEGGAYERLWNFNALRNDDQHNDFIPAVTVVEVANINARIGTGIIRNLSSRFNAAHSHVFFDSHVPVATDDNFNTAIDVKFGQGTIFENEPVIPTLTQIAQMVGETLDWFEGLVRREKKIT